MDTAALLQTFVFGWCHLQLRNLGHKRCRKEGVGGMIRVLEGGIPPNGLGPEIVMRRTAVGMLRSHCVTCGKCKNAYE